MKNIMPPINTPDNAFHDGNPATGEQGTIVPGLWLNNSQDATRNIQQELISVLTSAGVEIDESENNQLLLAILELIATRSPDLPVASTTQKGIVQLSNATNSTSETFAATPKAVRAVDIAALKVANNLSEIKGAGPAAVAETLTNLGFTGIGIGLPSQGSISNFDFQTFAFTSGANYLAVTTNWLNPPAGINYGNGTVSITVDYVTATNRVGLTLILDTTSQTNYRVYKVLCVGAPGSRVFTVREEWNSANPVPIAGGGTGATTVEAALANFGLTDGSLIPVGVPIPYPQAVPPTGWIKCNGAAINAAAYPKLAAIYGTTLPDMRAQIIRGWDDGRGIDAGRGMLSTQGDAIQNITGTLYNMANILGPNAQGAFVTSAGSGTTLVAGSQSSAYTVFFDASRIVRTASETRVFNIAYNYIVRAA